MANKNMNKAKKAKNDEFYTQMTDIEKELRHYREQFKGKIVYCNCDDPEYFEGTSDDDDDKGSNFWNYFYLNFEFLGLKKLIATHYDDIEPTYKLEYDGEEVVKTNLEQNGDFRSDESIELLKESDIVCTNPPFSLYREYVAQLMEYEKDFLIIGNFNSVTYKEIFPLIKDGLLWMGYGNVKEFIQPDGSIKKFGNISWFTNLDVSKRHEKMILFRGYNEEDYPTYDNYDAINVDRVSDIPMDYDGVMGVPITFLTKYNPKQFEILGMASGRNEFSKEAWPIKRYENALQHNKDGSTTSGSKANTRAILLMDKAPVGESIYYTADNAEGAMSSIYARILIKNKNPEVSKDED